MSLPCSANIKENYTRTIRDLCMGFICRACTSLKYKELHKLCLPKMRQKSAKLGLNSAQAVKIQTKHKKCCHGKSCYCSLGKCNLYQLI